MFKQVTALLVGKVKKIFVSAFDHGSIEEATFDKEGRQVLWPYQVRDLAATAQATLTNGTITAFLAAGGSGVFYDLVHVTFANASTASASVALVDDGTIRKTVQVPAASTISLDFTYPYPQSTSNRAWQVDMEDITGTTVTIDAVFIKNA